MVTDTDLHSMDRNELVDLQKRVEKAIKSYDDRKRADAISAAKEAAKQHGFALDDLLGSAGASKTKSVPKYAHPQDPAKTWTGRGRKPNWVQEHLDAGKSLEDLKIGG